MDDKETHVGKMEMRMKQWGAKLDALIADAEEAGIEAKADYRKRIDCLRSKQQVVQSKLDELRAAGSDKWETFKVGVESAWDELENAFRELKK